VTLPSILARLRELPCLRGPFTARAARKAAAIFRRGRRPSFPCRMLRLPTIRDRFTEIAAAAGREQMTYLGFLSELMIAGRSTTRQ
jgi:hypothetical protein